MRRAATLSVLFVVCLLFACAKKPAEYFEQGLESICRTGDELVVMPGAKVKQVRGTLINPEDESTPPEGAEVRLSSLEREGVAYTTTTDADGLFDFGKVPRGAYRLSACKPGWNARTMIVVVSRCGKERSLRIYLDLVLHDDVEPPTQGFLVPSPDPAPVALALSSASGTEAPRHRQGERSYLT